MHDDILSKWNAQVDVADTVYNLGDLTFKSGQRKQDVINLLPKLNGKHILIKGNHDFRDKIANFPTIELHDSLIIDIGGIDFLLSHFPSKDNMPKKDVIERPECFTADVFGADGKKLPLLHGHTHDIFTIRPGGLCVCWDRWSRLLSEDEILDIYNDTNGFAENLDKYNNLHGGIKGEN